MQLLSHVQARPELDPEDALSEALTTQLQTEVASMNRENFIVSMHLEAVNHFRERVAWEHLSEADLQGLEATLVQIGEGDGEGLRSGFLARSEAHSLAHFVRRLVGLDRAAAQAAFSEFLEDRSLTPPQIRFVEMVIDQLTARGVMDASALYEPPFSSLHSGGPDALFSGKENVIGGSSKGRKSSGQGSARRPASRTGAWEQPASRVASEEGGAGRPTYNVGVVRSGLELGRGVTNHLSGTVPSGRFVSSGFSSLVRLIRRTPFFSSS